MTSRATLRGLGVGAVVGALCSSLFHLSRSPPTPSPVTAPPTPPPVPASPPPPESATSASSSTAAPATPATPPSPPPPPGLLFGTPSTTIVQSYRQHSLGFDPSLRNPRWVAESIDEAMLRGTADRQHIAFVEDERIPPRFRNKLEHFVRSGLDRGHMAPAADFKSDVEAMQESFVLSNISPQTGVGFNRHYWARLESFGRRLTRSHRRVHILTGPLFLPTQRPDGRWRVSYRVLGAPPAAVAVPTHFFKVFVAEGRKVVDGRSDPDKDKETEAETDKEKDATDFAVAAFALPNEAIDPATPVTDFLVRLEDLESAAGFSVYDKLLSDPVREALDAKLGLHHRLLEGRPRRPPTPDTEVAAADAAPPSIATDAPSPPVESSPSPTEQTTTVAASEVPSQTPATERSPVEAESGSTPLAPPTPDTHSELDGSAPPPDRAASAPPSLEPVREFPPLSFLGSLERAVTPATPIEDTANHRVFYHLCETVPCVLPPDWEERQRLAGVAEAELAKKTGDARPRATSL